jgi:serine phosphatase RsbU (regulator of sigma subunit)
MRLGIKLALVFLLLAVLPLAWITIYSYRASDAAVRKAVEAESGALAEEMGSRMAATRRELSYRVERLGNFPFPQLMALKDQKIDTQSNPYMAKLMAEIGDVAPMVDSIEFSAGGPNAPLSAPPKPAPANQPKPQGLVIQLSTETPPSAPNPKPGPYGPPREGFLMRMRPSSPGAPHKELPPLTEADKEKIKAELAQIREFQVVLEKMGDVPGLNWGNRADPRSAADAWKKAPGDAQGNSASASKKMGNQAFHMQRNNPLANNFGAEVRADGNTIGTVNARISSRQMFRSILTGGQHRKGEIAFVIDADKTLHTVSTADEKKLQDLGLPGTSDESSMQKAPQALKDWVVVTRKDEGSNITFGIARPISEPLREIRNTAARNLAYGLGLVAVSLVGILPLSHRMTRNLAALTEGAEQLAHGNLNARVQVRSRDEIGRLAESFNRMAHDLNENQKHLLEQERLRKELEMSRRIQEELLPKQPLCTGSVEVKGVSIPAREVGGDFFNYFPLPDGEVAILVGDVSGKGVAAALLMANLQATLQARLPLVPDLAELARQLDHEISASTPPEVYLTLFMSILDPKESQLRYVNAGHNTQFALHADASIDALESTGRPLGLVPGGGYEERRIKLAAGDALFLYTDGLIDAENSEGQEFGYDHLESVLLEARLSGINEILTRVEEENRKHRGEVEAADDATMLVLKISATTGGNTVH